MRNANPAFLAALAAAGDDGLIVRKFMFVTGHTRDGTPVEVGIGLWTGDDDVTVNVMDGQTGLVVNRTYYGMGTSLKIPTIPRVSDMSIQTLQISISQLNNIDQIMVRENTVRFAKVDIHEGILSPMTGTLVSAPEIAFLGEVDGDPIDTPEAGGEGSITLEIVSDAIRALTRTNPAKRSAATQSRRAGDQFSKYSNRTANMEMPWGEVRAGGSNGDSNFVKAVKTLIGYK